MNETAGVKDPLPGPMDSLTENKISNDQTIGTTLEETAMPLTEDSSFLPGNEMSVSLPTPSTSSIVNSVCINNKEDTCTRDEIKDKLSEMLTFKENESKKRKRCEEDKNIFLDVFLRLMYPLNETIEKTVTAGIFKSLNYKPAVLLSQCGKPSLLFTVEMWDRFTKYEPIIEAYLYNNVTGRKTAMGFPNSNIEIDSVRIRGTQFVRFRDLSKYNVKILLTFEEFHILSNLTPAIIRYIHQLTMYHPLIYDYLASSINTSPVVPLLYGPIDPSIYNRLPQEVSFYRRCELFFKRQQCDEVSSDNDIQNKDTPENLTGNIPNVAVKADDTAT